MERTYVGTCVVGLEDTARDALQAAVRDARVERVGEGFLRFVTDAGHDALRRLRFFHNVFAVLSWHEDLPAEEPLKALAAEAREDPGMIANLELHASKGGSFTVMASVANQPASIPHFALEKLERVIRAAGRYEVDRQNPKLTLWLTVRREGFGFCGLRLTRGSPQLQPGTLRPELCHLLCLLSAPSSDDIFLDPYCGSGAIALERAAAWPCREAWAGDADEQAVSRAAAEAVRRKLPVKTVPLDAETLDAFADGTVSAIVTDPPWGVYNGGQAPDLPRMLRSFRRVLRAGGRLVLLLGRDLGLTDEEAGAAGFAHMARHAILLSGQKATVHVMQAG